MKGACKGMENKHSLESLVFPLWMCFFICGDWRGPLTGITPVSFTGSSHHKVKPQRNADGRCWQHCRCTCKPIEAFAAQMKFCNTCSFESLITASSMTQHPELRKEAACRRDQQLTSSLPRTLIYISRALHRS